MHCIHLFLRCHIKSQLQGSDLFSALLPSCAKAQKGALTCRPRVCGLQEHTRWTNECAGCPVCNYALLQHHQRHCHPACHLCRESCLLQGACCWHVLCPALDLGPGKCPMPHVLVQLVHAVLAQQSDGIESCTQVLQESGFSRCGWQ